MRKFIQSIILSILALVSVSSFAGTYDGSLLTDQQRIDMFNSAKNELLSRNSTKISGVVAKQDHRFNGKLGYIGSIEYQRTSSMSLSYADKAVIHVFDNTVVSYYYESNVNSPCRLLTPTSTGYCWGSNGRLTSLSGAQGSIKPLEFMTEIISLKSGSNISTVRNTEMGVSLFYNNNFNITVSETSYNPTNLLTAKTLSGAYVDALQNTDGTWATVLVTTVPIQLNPVTVPLPYTPPVAQDCSNPDYTNKKSSSICLVGQVIEGCKLTTDNYQAFINTVAGNVGMTSVDLKITCSTGVNYHLKPIHDMISIQGTQETLKLTGWKDSGRGDKLTPLSAKVMTGNGNEQSVPIYFTLEGKGPSGTYGNSLINKFVGTAVYPIEISY